MAEIRFAQTSDETFWYKLDRHLPKEVFLEKIRTKRGYVLSENGVDAALLRYNLFWDNIPFCTMLFVDNRFRGRGYGKMLMAFWEKEMAKQGYGMVLTSTQVNETAQHFYRKLGYKDCGGLILDIPGYAQPMEMFLSKEIAVGGDVSVIQ